MSGRLLAGALLAALLGPGSPQRADAADHAVIFMYHHVATSTPPSTSVTPERFRAQMDYLEREDYTVLPLAELIDALRSGRPVPERSVALTFDDGYVSVGKTAMPELARRGWPFTVFVSPDYVDRGFSDFLTWDELRNIAARGGSVGNHSLAHDHLVRRKPGESGAAWSERVRQDILQAQARLETELGDRATRLFAYPYGEYDPELAALVGELGFVGLGQQSGAIGSRSDWLALPRFPVATGYDALDEFALRARTRPLYLLVVDPRATLDPAPDRRPAMTADVPDGLARRDELACYVSGQGRVPLDWTSQDRFVVRPETPLGPGRAKVNCTVPDATEPGVFLWFSKLWMTRRPDGGWYSD